MTPFLQMRGISKRYGGTQALRAVDFSASSGEVHAIVGENGAGKSTLSRILTGAIQSDAGEILLDGAPPAIDSPLRGQQLGIRMVHQHANLVPNLSVTENILLGAMPTAGVPWWIDWPAAHRKAQEILRVIGFRGIDVRLLLISSSCEVAHGKRFLVMHEGAWRRVAQAAEEVLRHPERPWRARRRSSFAGSRRTS